MVRRCCFLLSTTTFSTVGYGDLVLPRAWRILGPIEAINGVLMCDLSAGFLFGEVALRHTLRVKCSVL